jgi:hypothetical protein
MITYNHSLSQDVIVTNQPEIDIKRLKKDLSPCPKGFHPSLKIQCLVPRLSFKHRACKLLNGAKLLVPSKGLENFEEKKKYYLAFHVE